MNVRTLGALLLCAGCAASQPQAQTTVQPPDEETSLRAAVSELLPRLQGCLQGTHGVDVAMILSVERDGEVYPHVQSSNTDDESVHRCLYDTGRAWRILRRGDASPRNVTFRLSSAGQVPPEMKVAPWNLFGWTHGTSLDHALVGEACMVCLTAEGAIQKLAILEIWKDLPRDPERSKRVYSRRHFKPPPSLPYCLTVGSQLINR